LDLFTSDIWEAAQMVTRSGPCGDHFVRGCIECLSTMHQPYGLMQRLMTAGDAQRRRVFRWNVLDTLETCPPARDCASCPLWTDCGGRAKTGRGFIAVDDAVQQRERTDPPSWRSEML